MKIDAVITWVDGDDPAHRASRERYGDKAAFARDDVAGSTRYASIGEIFWCVASINRFAPFINRIYIVTDNQNPHLDDFLQRNFPQGHIPVETVDHKVIFRGYEEYLPVFNSLAIETMLWRIPGLSEHFVYFNDDCLLTAPVTPGDFFTGDGVVCYASRQLTVLTDLTRGWKTLLHGGQKQVTFKGMIRNAVDVLGGGAWYLRYGHTPKALLRSFFEDFYRARPDAVLRNISHRFRDVTQFSTEEVLYMSLCRAGRCEVRSSRGKLFFFQMKNRAGYLDRKLKTLDRGRYIFCCFNSLDKLSDGDRQRVVAWTEARLGIRSV